MSDLGNSTLLLIFVLVYFTVIISNKIFWNLIQGMFSSSGTTKKRWLDPTLQSDLKRAWRNDHRWGKGSSGGQWGGPQESSFSLLCLGLGWTLPHSHVSGVTVCILTTGWLRLSYGVSPDANLPAPVRWFLRLDSDPYYQPNLWNPPPLISSFSFITPYYMPQPDNLFNYKELKHHEGRYICFSSPKSWTLLSSHQSYHAYPQPDTPAAYDLPLKFFRFS